jgi:hypothetical protein
MKSKYFKPTAPIANIIEEEVRLRTYYSWRDGEEPEEINVAPLKRIITLLQEDQIKRFSDFRTSSGGMTSLG